MLKELQIRGFALIDQLELSFYSGFSVLTGETGAGKSIIIDALSLLLGARASLEMIRTGCEEAMVEGCFSVQPMVKARLDEWGINGDEDLIIAREIHKSGRNKCRINGNLATLGQLNQLSIYLVDILGQHDHQSLLDVEGHIQLLDSFGNPNYQRLKTDIAQFYQQYHKVRTDRLRLVNSERERIRRIDLLQFQVAEIEQAQLKQGEQTRLVEERTRLAYGERILTTCGKIYSRLQEQQEDQRSLQADLADIANDLKSLARYDSSLLSISELFNSALVQLEEGSHDLRYYLEEYEVDPNRLDEVEQRLQLIHDLQRKYGETVEDILEYLDQSQVELGELMNSERTIGTLDMEEKELYDQLHTLSHELTAERKANGLKLESLMEHELANLNMDKTRFSVEITPAKEILSSGMDHVEFKISANIGEDLKPLAKIASGGEMSRIMLALKTILAETESIPTLIFDEVDTGIGGLTAERVAAKLKKLSHHFQVLSVTHLPVVASYAHQHYQIQKLTSQGRTVVSVGSLNQEQRIAEITRMLGSQDNQGITVAHAKELLKNASTS